MNKDKLIVILGPTATGKTGFATHLAYKIKGEIISADSRQVYKRMDLGTGKDYDDYIINDEKIPYHLIDIVEPGYEYSVFEFQKDFYNAFKGINSINKTPILCGGSGLYLESVIKGYDLINVPVNDLFRKQSESMSDEELAELLKGYVDIHNTTDTSSRKRLIRAVEIAIHQKENPEKTESVKPDSLIFGLNLERNAVRSRITKRLKERLKEGLIDEVINLQKEGISRKKLVYYGLEYKFIANFLAKEYRYNDMFQKLNSAIHQFSKRQMTWFRRMEKKGIKIHWIDGRKNNNERAEEAVNIIENLHFI